MKATCVQFNKFESKNMKGFANIALHMDDSSDACLFINGIKVMDSEHGLWLGMPSTKKEDKWYDTVKVVTSTKEKSNPAGDALNEEILRAIRIKMGAPSAAPKQQQPMSEQSIEENIPF